MAGFSGFNRNNRLNTIGKNVSISKAVTFPSGGSSYTSNGSTYRVYQGSGTVDAQSPNPATISYNPRSRVIKSNESSAKVDLLLVAGGGGGQPAQYHGGGGGGGVVFSENLELPVSESISITIGGGGGDSQFGPLAQAKGGGQGTHDTGPSAGSGGSGGGGAFRPNNFRPANSGGSGTQPGQPGISGSDGHGSPGRPAPSHGDQGGNGGGAGGQNGSVHQAPDTFLPQTNPGFPSPFMGAGQGDTWYRSFGGGGRGQKYGTSSNIPGPGDPGRGQGANGPPWSGGSGSCIIRVV